MDSIKKEIDKKMKQMNPFLFKLKREKLGLLLNDHSKWYIIVLVVLILFFCLQVINIPFLNFIQIDDQTIRNLIDSRTTNIVTMISVTFAIIGFLISNLVFKDSFTYNLLFKKSYFFPVAFFALTLIVAFIILSTLKDTLPLEYQGKTLLVGTYLIVIVVFLIGLLFTQLVKFTNQKYILELVKKEIISESKENLLVIAKRLISAEIISEFGFAQYSMAFFTPKTKGKFQISQNHCAVSDIQIKKIRELTKTETIKNTIFVNNLWLYREIQEKNDDGFFYVEQGNEERTKLAEDLNKCVVTTSKSLIINNEAKDYVIQKLNDNIKTNNDKLVEVYFDILFEMYKLQQDLKF
jgi:hypothetical protein